MKACIEKIHERMAEEETEKEVYFLRNFAVKGSREMVEAGGERIKGDFFLDETLQHVHMLM